MKNDVKKLYELLQKSENHHLDVWSLIPDSELNPEEASWVLSFGCPNGNGAYLQVLFDEKERILESKVINPDGDPCSCEWCQPPKKKPKKGKRK